MVKSDRKKELEVIVDAGLQESEEDFLMDGNIIKVVKQFKGPIL